MSTTTTKLSSKEIQEFITNNPNMDAVQIANELGIKHRTVTANIAVLTRNETKLNNSVDVSLPIDKKARQKVYQERWLAKKKSTQKIGIINNGTINNITNIYNGVTEETIGNYKNANGVKKQEARAVMVGYINESNVVGIIPTLTNIETVIEEAILAEHPSMQFIAVEREKPVYLKLKKILKAKNKQYGRIAFGHHFGDMSDMIYGKNADTFSHLLLDYCGCLPTVAREIKTAIDNDIVKVGGIIAVTYLRANRKGKGEYFDYIKSLKPKSNNANDYRKNSDVENESFFAEITGRNYAVREFFYYKDKSAMGLCVIQRVK